MVAMAGVPGRRTLRTKAPIDYTSDLYVKGPRASVRESGHSSGGYASVDPPSGRKASAHTARSGQAQSRSPSPAKTRNSADVKRYGTAKKDPSPVRAQARAAGINVSPTRRTRALDRARKPVAPESPKQLDVASQGGAQDSDALPTKRRGEPVAGTARAKRPRNMQGGAISPTFCASVSTHQAW
jgi:hypothetical protein